MEQENGINENLNENPVDKKAEQVQRVKTLMANLEALGLDINLLFDMMGGIAENQIKKTEVTLAGLIEAKTKTLGENLSGQVNESFEKMNAQVKPLVGFVDQIQKQASVQSTAVMPADGALPPGPGLSNDGGSGPAAVLNNLQPILKMLGLIPTTGTNVDSGNNGLAQMASMAKSWGEVMRAMMEPVVQMQTTMRQSILSEMQTYSKTGGSLPWDGDPEEQPGRQVAALNQRRREKVEIDYEKLAAEMAKRM